MLRNDVSPREINSSRVYAHNRDSTRPRAVADRHSSASPSQANSSTRISSQAAHRLPFVERIIDAKSLTSDIYADQVSRVFGRVTKRHELGRVSRRIHVYTGVRIRSWKRHTLPIRVRRTFDPKKFHECRRSFFI